MAHNAAYSSTLDYSCALRLMKTRQGRARVYGDRSTLPSRPLLSIIHHLTRFGTYDFGALRT